MSIGTYTPDTIVSGNVPSEVPNENGDPGSVNAPAVAEPSSAFTGGKSVLLIAASGADAAYGGCEVHVSFDGTNYSKIGTIESSAPQGVLTGTLADHADPDTTNTLHVDCTESFAAPPAGITNADADNDRTLSLVCTQPSAGVLDNAGELLAFGAVSATGTYTADLTYLRRGQLGSAHAAHASGAMFTVLDPLGESGTDLRYDLPPQYIATTIYLKFAAFNQFGNATQDLSLVTEYSFTPLGRGYGGGTNGVPTTPTGLATSAGVQQVSLSWSANPATDNVTAYKVFRAAGTGASFGSASLIATVGGLAYLDTGLGVATGYTYFLEAVNAVGASVNTSGVNATTSATALGTVTTTGSPSSGNLAKFSGASSITNADLTGDVTTSGGVATTLAASGVSAATYGDSTHVPQIAVDAKGRITSASNVAIAGGSGTVTSVAMTGDGTVFNASVTGSPVTTSGTLTPSLHTQSAKTALMGPTSGSAAAPTFRQPADADLSVTDITTNNVSTSAHGFAPKSPNNAAVYLDGTGNYSTPSGSGGGGGTGAWWNFNIVPSSTFTHNFSTTGNLFTPQINVTVYEANVLLTTVNSATYKIGIAPYNTGTNKITSAPTYGPVFTIGSSAGATNQWVRGYFTGGLACTAGTTYVIFVVRTDSTTTVSTQLNTGAGTSLNGITGISSAGIIQVSTGGSVHLASTGPLTSDTWTTESGFYILDFSYQFT